ncbi:Fc receptor-like B [Rhynchocyon petersi]
MSENQLNSSGIRDLFGFKVSGKGKGPFQHLSPCVAAADRATMWALTVLMLLVTSSGQAATLEKPTLSLHPPWTTIFKGERVTLRCDGYHPLLLELRPISTLWYLGHLLLPSHKKTIEVQTPGVYRCQTRGAPVSDPIHLSVSNDWLILQVPYAAVFEGESLIMRCRGWYDKVVYKLHYYRDGQAVRYFHSSANYTVPQARTSDSGRYQCSGTMRIPVESAPMFSAKVAVTVQELFPAPVLRLMGHVEPRGAAPGGVVVRCETRLHPQKRDTPLQFAFYKYSRVARRFDWGAEYTVPEPEVEELESYWCEAATATRSVRKRSPWLQLPGRGSGLDPVFTTAPAPQTAASAPGNKPLSFRKPPVSRSVPYATSSPNTTSSGLLFPMGGAPTAGPRACAPPTPLEQSAGALKPGVDLLLREMQLLKGLLSRVVQELKEPHALSGLTGTPETSASHLAVGEATPETTTVES